MTMKKFTSRKFLTALAGLITGIFLIIEGNITEGATTVASAVIAYCISEGYVDSKKLKNDIEKNLNE
ncbi:MAG: hypothetical protein E7600_00900 [Ruminococcaceae bacterium]|nr:hypothetical protein [Oscillospiraceae bacterium]